MIMLQQKKRNKKTGGRGKKCVPVSRVFLFIQISSHIVLFKAPEPLHLETAKALLADQRMYQLCNLAAEDIMTASLEEGLSARFNWKAMTLAPRYTDAMVLIRFPVIKSPEGPLVKFRDAYGWPKDHPLPCRLLYHESEHGRHVSFTSLMKVPTPDTKR